MRARKERSRYGALAKSFRNGPIVTARIGSQSLSRKQLLLHILLSLSVSKRTERIDDALFSLFRSRRTANARTGPHADNPFIRSIHTRPTHSGATAKRHSKTGMFAFAICVQFISRKGTLADGSQMNSLSVRPSDRRHVLCYISCSRWRTSWADFNSIYGGTYGRAEIKENATIHLSEPSHFAQKANTIKTNLGGARVRASSGAKSVA